MVPEKAASLLEANLYLKNMANGKGMTSEQKNSIKTLLNCFVSITEYGEWLTRQHMEECSMDVHPHMALK